MSREMPSALDRAQDRIAELEAELKIAQGHPTHFKLLALRERIAELENANIKLTEYGVAADKRIENLEKRRRWLREALDQVMKAACDELEDKT